MNVLADRHHSGLYHSLQLMAARFGWDLYTPTGMAWWDEGVWAFGRGTYPDARLAEQYLHLEGDDGEFPNAPIGYVTFDDAKRMDWAYVIATVQDNEPGFARFARKHGAEFVVAVGNTGQRVDWSLDPLALMSSEVPILGRGIVVHQEMDRIDYSPPVARPIAASFVNCMPQMGWCYDLLVEAKALGLPVAVHGIEGPDGIVKPNTALVDIMRSVGWGWHDKAHGDGFGHVIHSWAAVGRPLIGHSSFYRGKMAAPFWQDGVTCIDLDKHPIPEVVEMVRGMGRAEHERMCESIRAVFDETVDYDAEADRIADFLGLRVPA